MATPPEIKSPFFTVRGPGVSLGAQGAKQGLKRSQAFGPGSTADPLAQAGRRPAHPFATRSKAILPHIPGLELAQQRRNGAGQ